MTDCERQASVSDNDIRVARVADLLMEHFCGDGETQSALNDREAIAVAVDIVRLLEQVHFEREK